MAHGAVTTEQQVLSQLTYKASQWLRNLRVEAYIALFGAYETCKRQLRNYVDSMESLDEDADERDRHTVAAVVWDIAEPLLGAISSARLLGNQNVMSACDRLEGALAVALTDTLIQASACTGTNENAIGAMSDAYLAFRKQAEEVIATPAKPDGKDRRPSR